MTCIVGLVDGGRVWMGGNSAGVAGLDISLRADRKVFRNGEFLIGFTSSFRMGQLLHFRLQPPPLQPDQDLFRYMVCDFVEAVRTCLKDGGFAHRSNDVETGGFFLVGTQGRLFSIQDDYQVSEFSRGYHAIGCGAHYALGALYSSAGQPADSRVLGALATAEHFSGGVRAPFHLDSLPASIAPSLVAA
jgi:ATP-dependent protease HslVU (ClpYQ) peptidase subunit